MKNRHLSLLAVCVALFVTLRGSAAEKATPPVITLEERAAVITGLTPNGKVVVFAVSRKPMGTASVTAKQAITGTADAAGNARIEFREPFAARSIVTAIDYERGGYAIVAPEGSELRLSDLPRTALKKNADEYDQLIVGGGMVEALCVRPGRGAWRARVHDGGTGDRDGAADGGVILDPATMKRFVGDDETLRKFRNKDVVVVIDPLRMEVMATEVAQ